MSRYLKFEFWIISWTKLQLFLSKVSNLAIMIDIDNGRFVKTSKKPLFVRILDHPPDSHLRSAGPPTLRRGASHHDYGKNIPESSEHTDPEISALLWSISPLFSLPKSTSISQCSRITLRAVGLYESLQGQCPIP